MDPYEYDAPRYIDFLGHAEGEEDSDTDAWFDYRKCVHDPSNLDLD